MKSPWGKIDSQPKTALSSGGTRVCELRFEQPDPHNPGYSLTERNFYVWIPRETRLNTENHRLTLRRNLLTRKFEVYRAYRRPFHILSRGGTVHSNRTLGNEEVAYTGGLRGALKFGSGEYRKFHGRKLNEKPCTHKPPEIDPYCPRHDLE